MPRWERATAHPELRLSTFPLNESTSGGFIAILSSRGSAYRTFLRCRKDSAMRSLVDVSVIVILAVTSVRAEPLPNQEPASAAADVADRSELRKMLSAVPYDRDIGKIARIHYYSAKGAKLEDARRIFVSVKSNVMPRREPSRCKSRLSNRSTKELVSGPSAKSTARTQSSKWTCSRRRTTAGESLR